VTRPSFDNTPAGHSGPVAAAPVTFDDEFLADPARGWARLLTAGPVHAAITPEGAPVWLVTDHEEARQAALDPRLSLDKRHARGGYAGFSLPPALDRNLLNMDGPEHTRVRRLVAKGFTPRRVEALRPCIEIIASALADDVATQLAAQDEIDVIAAYAAPLAVRVIAELLGVPEQHHRDFRTWTDRMLAPVSSTDAAEALGTLHSHLLELVASKQSSPSDDLLSDLIAARDGADTLDEDELVSAAFLLLFAGYENTTHVLGNGLTAVLTRDGHADELRAALTGPNTARAAIDELMRFDPPPQLAIRRFAVEDLDIAGQPVAEGDTVMLSWAAANQDPAIFDAPEQLRLDREPNPHLTLGHGMHVCLGAALARSELEIGLRVLLDTVPTIRLARTPDRLRWRASFRNRGLQHLPVTEHSLSRSPR
jgi:hypothetical protein